MIRSCGISPRPRSARRARRRSAASPRPSADRAPAPRASRSARAAPALGGAPPAAARCPRAATRRGIGAGRAGGCRGSRPRRGSSGRPRRARSRPSLPRSPPAATLAASDSGSPNRMQKDSCSPRPTRPRSWWSWESPKRSAPSTSITVALGDVDADLDHGGGHQHVGLARDEASMARRLLRPRTSARAAAHLEVAELRRWRAASPRPRRPGPRVSSDSLTSGQTT